MFQTATSRPLLVLLIVLSASTLVSGIFLHYNVKLNLSKNVILVEYDNIDLGNPDLKSQLPKNIGLNLPYYKNISKISLDERCITGKALGAAILQYSPYGNTVPFYKMGKQGQALYGIIPSILKKAMRVCCHRNSGIKFAKILTSQKINFGDYDFYFPISGDGMDATSYHDNPFIPIVQAPSVALLLYNDNSKEPKTGLIIMTIFKAWPMLVFLLLMASCSGIIMWFLDHSQNSEDFPQPFKNGVWEGFWWAFITMTTVGYGDRLPKSYLARIFCLMWIVFGVINISIFTGMIIAAFSASTKNYFAVHGAKIGAVSGSKEFKLGHSLNADMKAFESNIKSITALFMRQVDGVLIDNFVVLHSGDEIANHPLRVERMIEHPITYGVTLGQNSSYLSGCVRKYILDNPQDVFEMIRTNLHPLINPADEQNDRLKEAEKLFYQSDTFNKILMYGAACFGAMLMFGIIRNLYIYCNNMGKASNKFSHEVVKDIKCHLGSFQKVDGSLKDLIEQYKCFQDGWASKLKSIHEE